MKTMNHKLSMLFAFVALTVGTGCAAETTADDTTAEPAPAPVALAVPHEAKAPADPKAAAPKELRDEEASPLPTPGDPGAIAPWGARDIPRDILQPPQPCPPAESIEAR